MGNESYWDEKPGDGGSGGGGVWWYPPGGGGGGPGGSGGGIPYFPWERDPDKDDEDDEEDDENYWEHDKSIPKPEKYVYKPYLKLLDKHLVLAEDGKLLMGGRDCIVFPSVLVWIRSGKKDFAKSHTRCLLLKRSDQGKELECDSISLKDWPNLRKTANLYGCRPMEYKLLCRWQGGHYNYKTKCDVKIDVWSWSSGWRKIPLNSWTSVATIRIREDGYYVNGVKADVHAHEWVNQERNKKEP